MWRMLCMNNQSSCGMWMPRKIHKPSNEPSYHHLAWQLSHHSLTYNTTFSQFYSNRNDGQNKAIQTPVRISIISTSPKIIPDKTLIDNYSKHIKGYLNRQLHMFNCQTALVHELLMKLRCQPFASNFMLNALLGEFTNIKSIYQLYEPNIQTAIQLLRTEPVLDRLTTADNPWPKRSLVPFFGNTLQWLMDSHYEGYTKIKWQVNWLI